MMGRQRTTIAIVTMLLTAAPIGRAHGQTAPAPLRYPLPTFEEDWRRLAAPDQSDDVWDPVKFVPLSDDRSTYMSLGGEARATYERFGNQDWGLGTPSPNGYYLQRLLWHADVHAGSRIR